MRKFLSSIIILMTFVFAVLADVPGSMLRIFVYPDVLEYAIKRHFSEENWDAASQEWENRMDEYGRMSVADISAVCASGHITDKNKCDAFQADTVTYFYDVCEGSTSRGISDCVKDFYAVLWGTWVRLPEAIGIAKEYALVKNNEIIVCEPFAKNVVEILDQPSYLDCTSVDGRHYYTFKFNATSETVDRMIINGTLRAIGKIHGVEFNNVDCTLERIYSDSNCSFSYNTSDTTVCEKINKSLKRFGHEAHIEKSERFGTRCEVFLDVLHASIKNNLTAYGIDNTVFKDVQVLYGPDVEQRIRSYVYNELKQKNIELKTFSCSASTGHKYLRNSFDLLAGHDEYVTCYVNGQPIDFIFDDLSEDKDWNQKSGLSKIACAQVGGKIDGRNCRGLNKQECVAVSNKIPGGTHWDRDSEACILNKANIANKINNTEQVLGGVALAVLVPEVAGAGEVWVLVSGVSSIILDQSFIQIDRLYELQPKKRAYDFVWDASLCKIPMGTTQCDDQQHYCADLVLKAHFARIGEIFDDLNTDQLRSVATAFLNLMQCLSDDEIKMAQSESTPQWEDYLLSAAKPFVMAASMIIAPEDVFEGMLRRAPELVNVFKRTKILFGRGSSLEGIGHYRLYVDNIVGGRVVPALDSEDINNLVKEIQKDGFFVSSNINPENRRFIAFHKGNIFSSWDNVPSNWLFHTPLDEKYNWLRRFNDFCYTSTVRMSPSMAASNAGMLNSEQNIVSRPVPVEGVAGGQQVVVAAYANKLENMGAERRIYDGFPEFFVRRDNSGFLQRANNLTGKEITSIRGVPVSLESVGMEGGRGIAIVKVGDKRIPFYVSSGTAGKTGVETGKWEVFFGIGRSSDGHPWYVKGRTEAEISAHYYSDELRQIGAALDTKLGDPRNIEYMLYTAGRKSQDGKGFVGQVDNLNTMTEREINSCFTYRPGVENRDAIISDIRDYLKRLNGNSGYENGTYTGNGAHTGNTNQGSWSNSSARINIEFTNKGVKIGKYEFVSARDSKGAKYYEYVISGISPNAYDRAHNMSHNLGEDTGMKFFVFERDDDYVVGVYDDVLRSHTNSGQHGSNGGSGNGGHGNNGGHGSNGGAGNGGHGNNGGHGTGAAPGIHNNAGISNEALVYFKTVDNTYNFEMGLITTDKNVSPQWVLQKWGLPEDATPVAIKKRYRELSQRFHTDKYEESNFFSEAQNVFTSIGNERNVIYRAKNMK